MNKLLLVFTLSFFSITAFANSFCERNQEQIRLNLKSESSRMAFKNTGGMINGGVCWWHNRLQRSSAYLVQFRPDLPRPSLVDLDQILTSLRFMNKVVTIPGYRDFSSFSSAYQEEIQDMLNEWQRYDGFLNFEWIRGISGNSKLSPEKMRIRMDTIYRYYKNSPVPLWIMAQIKGVTSHSLLILEMEKDDGGYHMIVIDSNHPKKNVLIRYELGDTSLRGEGNKYTFVPYAGFQKDFKKISQSLKSFCPQMLMDARMDNVEMGEIEID